MNNQEIGNIILAIVVAVIFFIIFGFIVKICWNFTIPNLFNGARDISLGQALVLLILVNLLFFGARSCANMTRVN